MVREAERTVDGLHGFVVLPLHPRPRSRGPGGEGVEDSDRTGDRIVTVLAKGTIASRVEP